MSDFLKRTFETFLNSFRLKRDRHVFSFNNGIYITKTDFKCNMYIDEWIPNEDPRSKIKEPVACRHFDMDFDENTLENEWWEIICEKCPAFKSIMDCQEWNIEVQKWLCILIGRNLYNLGEIEEWQVIGYLLGQAATGKSTILKNIVKEFYEPNDVGILSNNMSFVNLSEKFLFIAPEIKEDFAMDQSDFQDIITGRDNVSGNQTDKQPKFWKVPGMFAGRDIPRFNDHAGFVSRRLVVFMFNKKIKKLDPKLGEKLKKEIGHILHACNRAYLEAVDKHGSGYIWSVIPEDCYKK